MNSIAECRSRTGVATISGPVIVLFRKALLALGVSIVVACGGGGGSSSSGTTDPLASYKYSGTMPSSVENWPAAQSKARSQDWQAWVNTEAASLASWQARGGDRAEWIAGYIHEYVDPVTQAALTWTESTPPPAQGDPGSAQAKLFGAWVAYFRSSNVDYILKAARLYRLNGSASALAWARSQLDLYAAQYMQWPLQTREGESRMMGQSLDEATVMQVLVPAIRLLTPGVPASELNSWKQNLIKPMADSLMRGSRYNNNIGLWQSSALASAGLLLSDESMWAAGVSGPKGVLAIMAACVTADNFWIEGSFAYNDYVIRALLSLFHEATVAGRSAELATAVRVAHNLLANPVSLRFPDNTVPNPGDARGAPEAFNTALLQDATYLLPTPTGVSLWRSSKGWPQLFVDWTPGASASSLPWESRRMDATGFAMLRSNGWHLFLHFGQAVDNHAQYEALSFELHNDAGRIVTDLGTTLYGSDLHENYFSRAATHNVPMVNDLGQKNFALGRLTAFDPTTGSMSAEQTNYQPGVTVTRAFSLDSAGMTDVIAATGNMASSGTVGSIIHLDCSVSLPSLPSTSLVSLPAESGFSYWSGTKAYQLPAQFTFTATCGSLPMQVRVNGPSTGTLIVGSPPVLDGRIRSAMYLRYPVANGTIAARYSIAN
jgi:oligo-alginate lyase